MDNDHMLFTLELVKKLSSRQGRQFIARTADEFATANLMGGHRGASWQFQMLFDAEASLRGKQLRRLVVCLGLPEIDERPRSAGRRANAWLSPRVKSKIPKSSRFCSWLPC